MPIAVEVKLQPEVNLKPTTARRPAAAAKDRAAKSPYCGERKDLAKKIEGSEDGSNSSGSSCGLRRPPLAKNEAAQRRRKPKGVKVVPEGTVAASLSSLRLEVKSEAGKRRCAWITSYSEPLYVTFHDEVWGVPVHDDVKLFELLTLSMALAELSWPTILKKREIFRKLFDNFDPSYVAKFTERKILLLKENGISLSEQKLRAIVENANQILKVIEELGSFGNYCWSFVNHRPIINGHRYANQVPVKSPKAEVISKDLIRRGFRCVGPTVIYSFMQAAGIVNDHLSTCFRFKECSIPCNSVPRGGNRCTTKPAAEPETCSSCTNPSMETHLLSDPLKVTCE